MPRYTDTMAPGSRPAGAERVNAFPVGGGYLFRHYFEGERLFARLREYYDHAGYRFAVPEAEFDAVRRFLGERSYWLVVPEEPSAYVVAVRKYTAHPDDIFKAAVFQASEGEYNLFVLRDETAVSNAVAGGGVRLAETDLGVAYEDLADRVDVATLG